MTYIKLYDVQNILSIISDKYQSEHTGGWITGKILEEIKSLSSINPEEMIQKELDKIKEAEKNPIDENFPYYLIRITLEELLQKFNS